MTKKWTRRERREHIKEKYSEIRQKIFIIIAFALIFILLAYSIYHTLSINGDITLLAVLVIVFFILIPVAVFFMDLMWYEGA